MYLYIYILAGRRKRRHVTNGFRSNSYSVRFRMPNLQTAPGLSDRQSSDQSSYQKSLLFYNHTECECQSKMDETMPRDTMPPTADVIADHQSVAYRPGNRYFYSVAPKLWFKCDDIRGLHVTYKVVVVRSNGMRNEFGIFILPYCSNNTTTMFICLVILIGKLYISPEFQEKVLLIEYNSTFFNSYCWVKYGL